ncbi:diguanylate cyclase [Comamonas testosteroni]|uniref:diguanylate cyclase n=1 Tax=Comamonas testosteroni TaxID=285 RepID=A0A373FQE5_COMTE|nr:sensor domain-containing diguanylate cyclase [Comamonas testosteroni]RGE45762.1 diguanylate cyclase [Comamonas testosteroni]
MPSTKLEKSARPATRLDLRRLILVLTICSALIPFANTFYAGYLVQREQLIDNTLDGHYAYATKLARSTDDFLQSALQQLDYSAKLLAHHLDDTAYLNAEAARLRLQTESFNSVTIFTNTGYVLATSPETLQIKGKTLQSEGVVEALEAKGPVISQPYMAVTGNFIVFISQPIFSDKGEYLGAVGGSIYLKQESMLDTLLGSHFYQDESYVYVVDKNKFIIYHPDSSRVGSQITNNDAINQVSLGESGKTPLVNSKGVDMLAGYAVVPSTGWGIVAQRPKAATMAPLNTLMRSVLYKTLPIALLMLVVIWWSARRIASPLRQLADGAQDMDKPETAQNIQDVKSWYFEAQELKKAMLKGIGLLQRNITKLREDVNTDPLTGLGNRRHLEAAVTTFQRQATPFAVVAIDIDFFKKVNDSFGHDAGDQVLKQLARTMRDVSRADDVPCRVGGEEFLLLLPGAPLDAAAQVAERLRKLVQAMQLPVVGSVTISLGVAQWPESDDDIQTVFKQADAMLYVAKRSGRNRVVVKGSEPSIDERNEELVH